MFFIWNSFDVITDHKALEALNKGEIKSLRIQRWLYKLSEFNYNVVYRKGEDIPHADCLSRSYIKEVNFVGEDKPSVIMKWEERLLEISM